MPGLTVPRLPNRRRRRLQQMRQPQRRDYGDGGASGIVLSLTLSEDNPYDSVYTVNGKIGGQVFPLQVDTGSADLWVAAKSCSTTACSGASLYDPSVSSIPTNKTFTIQYLAGKVTGPIVWDDVSIGSYDVPSQALAAATNVQSERLAADEFSGVLGLAPALDSRIAQYIPPVVGNDPDGASWGSNLYGSDIPPTNPFFGILLERPEDPDTVSVLGLGMHPKDIPDFEPSALVWNPVVTSNDGALFWRVPVMEITVWINGQSSQLVLDKSAAVPTSARPIAVFDSGTPLILTSPSVANAFWGAYGINPAADGNFYPLCTTMINATMTIGNVVYPLHPLDMSIPSSSDPTSQNCVGGLQTVTGQTAGDIILGAAFLRNVYSVYTSNSSVYDAGNPPLISSPEPDLPHVGLYPLTNATAAAAAFQTVRVLNQPITPTSTPTGQSGGGQLNIPSVSTTSGLKAPLAVVIILAVVGFIALCAALYLLRGCLYRRQRERERKASGDPADLVFRNSKGRPDSNIDEQILFATLKKRSFRSTSDGTTLTTGTLGTGTGTGTEWDGSDVGTPLVELGEWMGFAGGRYPSPVRSSRVEIPMPVRRESGAEVLAGLEDEKDRSRSSIQRPLSTFSPGMGPPSPLRTRVPLVAEPMPMLPAEGSGGSSETIELPVIREEAVPSGPLLGNLSAVHGSAAKAPRQPRVTSPSRKPPPPPPKDLPPPPSDP